MGAVCLTVAGAAQAGSALGGLDSCFPLNCDA
jgi:hypothetical protein